MSESSTRHGSSAVQEAKVSHDAKADSEDALQYPSAPAQRREGGEHTTASATQCKVQIVDSKSSGKDGTVGVAPSLGEHEKYHVFFCYSSADAPWVEDMVQKLESDEYGFKCCIHERDFTPGAYVIKNITRSIQESQKTVFVLSRDFVDSKWCEFERQLVMSANLREENRKVIPVMLKKCDMLPDFLRHMTYLEEWTPYFFNRFIGALKDEPDSKPDGFSTFSYNPNYINGQHVLKIEPERTWGHPCCRFDDQILYAKLMSRGVRIEREDAVTVIKMVMKTAKMESFNWFYTKKGFLVHYFLIIFVTIFIQVAASHLNLVKFFCTMIGPVPGVAMLFFTGRYKMNKALKRTMVEVNTILAKYHIFATVTDRYLGIDKAVLHFVYYERGSCQLQLQEDLMAIFRAKQNSSSVEIDIRGEISDPEEPEHVSSCDVPEEMPRIFPQVSEESDESETPGTNVSENSPSSMSDLRTEADVLLLKYCDALLLKYSDLYVRLRVTKKLPKLYRSYGHTQQDICLCQLVEMCEFGWTVSFAPPGEDFSTMDTRIHNSNSGVAAVVADIVADLASVLFQFEIINVVKKS